MPTVTPQRGSAQPADDHPSGATHLDEWWADGALRAIATLAETGRIFTCDDLRRPPIALPEPAHPSHWGAVFTMARAEGTIRPVGYGPSATPSRHYGTLRRWRGGRGRAA